MARISSRIGAIAPSATLIVDSKAKALKAAGRPVIGFGAGEPDFPTPAHIVDAAREALNDPKNFRYSPASGLPELKQAIADKTLRDSGVKIDPSQVLITNGGKQAVYEAFATVIDDGDDVLIPAPYWTTYPECIRLAGGNPIEVFAGSDQDYKVSVEQLEAAYTPATKALIFVSPSNPTGAVYSKEILLEIAELARKHGLIIYADEIYDKILYDGAVHHHIAALAPDLLTITFNGLSKAYRVAGFRQGWMVLNGPKHHAQGYIEGLDMLASMRLCATTPMQHAIQTALGGYQSINELILPGGRLLEQRNKAYELITQIPGISCVKPMGAMYMFPKIDTEMYNIHDDMKFVYDLLVQEKVLLVHGTGFNWVKPDHFRIVTLAYSHQIEEAIGKLERFLKHYRQ